MCIRDSITRAFDSFQGELDLEAAGCYEDLPLTEQMQKDIALYEKVRDVYKRQMRNYRKNPPIWDLPL